MLTVEQIREKMGDRKISVVAQRLGITRPWLSAVIAGKVKASDKLMNRLSAYLDGDYKYGEEGDSAVTKEK